MYLRLIFIFIFSTALLLAHPLSAQNKTGETEDAFDDMPRRKIIRLGFDPTRFALSFWQPANRGGVELSLDTEFFKRFYVVGEAGYTFVDHKSESFNYKASGVFGRIGFDYNMLIPQDANDHDAFFLGFRFAGSKYSHSANNINYENRFGSVSTSIPTESISAYWSELTVGVKVEAFKNFFIGWTGRGKLNFRVPDTTIPPYIIPGYGRLDPDNGFTADMNIYILYAFSFR